jgi:hypothetical protein
MTGPHHALKNAQKESGLPLTGSGMHLDGAYRLPANFPGLGTLFAVYIDKPGNNSQMRSAIKPTHCFD